VHGAGAAPRHVLGGPAHPPVIVGPRRQSELVEGALHAKLPVRVQVRTVKADDGQDGMRGRCARSSLLEGGGGNGEGAGRGGQRHDDAYDGTSHRGEILHQRSEQIEMKKRSHHDGASDVEAIMPDTKPQPQMVFPKKAKSIISNNLDWTESTVPGEICWQNKSMQIECDENCQGGGGCYNKRIQKCKVKKVRKKRGEKGFGLFARISKRVSTRSSTLGKSCTKIPTTNTE
jgi:hypothetical protein